MALFRKRKDPLDVRSRELADEIKRLEREIRTLGKAPAPTPSVGHNGHPSPSSHVPATPPRAPVAPLPRQASIALPAREGFPRPAQTGPRQPHEIGRAHV